MPSALTNPTAAANLAALVWLTVCGTASAHPHIFVDAKAEVRFDREGRAHTLHNEWMFDEAYSAFAIQGLDADRDGQVTRNELQSLADENVTGLAEYGYYSSAGLGGRNVPLVNGRNAALDYADGRVTLSFDVDFAVPLPLTDVLELGISDPQYYVAIQFANRDTVRLLDAPDGCGVDLERPRPMPDDVAAQLYALPADVTTLPSALQNALRGVQGAILVDCGTSSATQHIADAPTAVEALDAFMSAAEAPIVLTPVSSPVVDDPIAQWRLPLFVALGVGGLAVVTAVIVRSQPHRSAKPANRSRKQDAQRFR